MKLFANLIYHAHLKYYLIIIFTLFLGACGGSSVSSGGSITDDTIPDAFSFTDVTNVASSSSQTSNSVTITGTTAATVITVTGGEYAVNGGIYTAIAGSVSNGDTVTIRHTAAGSDLTTVDTLLSIGGISDTFSSTTGDTVPDAFTFTDVTNIDPSSIQTSNTVSIAGITVAIVITVTGGEYAVNGGSFTALAGTVNNADTVTVRHTAAGSDLTTVDTLLSIGGISDTFSSTTGDTVPDAFIFTDVTNVAASSIQTSNTVTIAGITATTAITITSGEYAINGGIYTAVAGSVSNGDTVTVRHTSALISNGSTVNTTLTIGGITDIYSSTTTDTTGPVVSSTTPSSTGLPIDISRTADITANFNEDIIAGTVDTSSFNLVTGGTDASGTVSFDAVSNTATYTPPATKLNLLSPYTATLTTAITDLAGNALASTHNWDFITEDGAWGSAQLIETANADFAVPPAFIFAEGDPQIAFDSNGNALVVWYQSDGTRKNIWANRYTASSDSWGTAVLIETDNAGDARNPQVAIDPNGDAIAVWYQSDGTRNNIWANHYTANGDSWGTAGLIETDNTGDALRPQVAIDTNGNAIAVWYQSDGTRNNIWANRYTASGDSWGTAGLIETDNTGFAGDPQISIDANNNALAVWSQSDGARNNIMANRYTAIGDSWGTPGLIETDNAGSAETPQITVNSNGDALAVWLQSDGTRKNVWANRYTASSWGAAELIETGDDFAFNPQIAIDTNGNAISVWSQFPVGSSRTDIWANRYNANGNTWGTAKLIETNDAGGASAPQIAVDSNGNAVSVWFHSDGTGINIWANRYTINSDSWGIAERIELDNIGVDGNPQIAIDTNGNAIAVWPQNDGSRDKINANRLE